MPQIADLEIAATWDEIELEAALMGRAADTAGSPSAEVPSALAEALRAVESLKQLPREERKRRAEELLRALTSAPPAPIPGPEAPPQSLEQTPVDASLSVKPVAAPAETAPTSAEEPTSLEPAAPSPDALAPAVAEAPSVEPVAVEPTPAPVELPSAEVAVAVVAAGVTTAETPVVEPEPAIPHASVELSTAVSAPEVVAIVEPATADAPAIADPAPRESAASALAVESVSQTAPEIPTAPTAAPLFDAIPKFLTTECTALEPEQPDSLIPLRAVAAAGALIGAVLLIYLWSSQEFGVAARPIIGASEMSEPRPTPPQISASLAARQAFVAPPLDFSMGPQSVRPHRPAMMGFDLFDDPPTMAISTNAAAAPAPVQAAPVLQQSSVEATAALPPAAASDTAALIKRGDELLKAGDIAAARSAFERAAAGGNAKAQIGLGKTYDPLVLAKLGARGVRGDPVQAASWYARAGEAGDEEGQQRLHALISGLSDCMLSQGTCATRKP